MGLRTTGVLMRETYLLLVEDNQDDRFFTLRTLRRHGFKVDVKVVSDGAEALSLLQSAPELPVAVLLDCRLPRLSGDELVALLRDDERTRDLPIILLTGSEDERRRMCSKDAELSRRVDACLSKPLSWRNFSRALRRLGLMETLIADRASSPASYRLKLAS